MNEEQDSVRYNLINLITSLSLKINDKELASIKLNPLFVRLGQDPSWRVRYMVANKFAGFCKTLEPNFVRDNLITLFINLVDDEEPEVRASIGQEVAGFGQIIGTDLALKHLSLCIDTLLEDKSSQVRENLAGHVTFLAPVFGKEKTIEVLLPIFIKLLKDEVPEVRLKLIAKLEQVNLVIGVQLLSENLLPAILELAADPNWRIRIAVIEQIPILAQHLGQEFFGQSLSQVCCQKWLEDRVCSVREKAIETFPYLIQNFDQGWINKNLLLNLKNLVSNTNYLYRCSSIKACTTIIPVTTDDKMNAEVWGYILALLKDPVPNVRFNVAKELLTLTNTFSWNSNTDLINPDVYKNIKDTLQLYSENETDQDVKYFSHLVFAKLK